MQDVLDVTRYHSAQIFLKDYMAYRTSFDHKFSYGAWAKELNFTSRTYLRLLVIGERPIKEQMIPEFIRVIGLKGAKAEFFKNLVHFSQAKTAEEKKVFGLKLIALVNQKNETSDIHEHFEFVALDEKELEEIRQGLTALIKSSIADRAGDTVASRRMYQISFTATPMSMVIKPET